MKEEEKCQFGKAWVDQSFSNSESEELSEILESEENRCNSIYFKKRMAEMNAEIINDSSVVDNCHVYSSYIVIPARFSLVYYSNTLLYIIYSI